MCDSDVQITSLLVLQMQLFNRIHPQLHVNCDSNSLVQTDMCSLFMNYVAELYVDLILRGLNLHRLGNTASPVSHGKIEI